MHSIPQLGIKAYHVTVISKPFLALVLWNISAPENQDKKGDSDNFHQQQANTRR
jgi:hypothetical protein